MAYETIKRFDGTAVKTFPDLTDAQLETKVAAAAECYGEWRRKSYGQRATIIGRAAAIMHDRADALARVMTVDMGKRIAQARGEGEFSSREDMADIEIARLDSINSVFERPAHDGVAARVVIDDGPVKTVTTAPELAAAAR